MSSEVVICEVCRQQVTPGAPGVVRAVRLLYEQDFGGEPAEPSEGDEMFFHEQHISEATGHYRIK